ncbi:MAG: diguanylate cyclase [Rhodospirillales bacterium]|nr:diguanylate cyclase [Rhodospirillales bacterium]MCB9996724.1 diguanylate cyclase [Rhodospirillales bacterium]
MSINTQTGERRDPIYLLTIGYMLALVIIAVMSVCIHVVIGQVVKEQNNAAVVVSGRQAKLSQKIAFYATQYVQYRDPVFHDQLEDAVLLMHDSHKALIQGDKGLNIPDSPSGQIQRVYFGLPYNLDKKVTDFLMHADAFLDKPAEQISADDPDYRYLIETAKGPLITALDAATMAYEAESEIRIAKLQSYQKMALFVIFATLIAEAVLIFRPLVSRVHRYAERLKQLALTDGLTGVDNSRSFMHKCMKELKRCRRLEKPLCVAILDIDHFKSVNDRYGHLVGDDVLKAFAQFVQRSMRIEDEFARIGGEEFAVLLPHTPLDGAALVADRIRNIVEISPIRPENYDGGELFITVSIGVAEVDLDAPSIDAAMSAADKALYKAKTGGRNRVVASDDYSSVGNVVPLEKPKRG